MLLEELTQEELEIAEMVHDPVAMVECLFSPKLDNPDSLRKYSEDEFFKVRLYQLPMLSYEYLIAENDDLTLAENFDLKKGAGTIFLYCGRKIGKTLVGVLMDLMLDAVHNIVDWVTAFSSFDELHIAPVLDPLTGALENHPFFKLFNYRRRKNPYHKIHSPDFTYTLEGINMNVNKSPSQQGSSFERVRANKMIIDEHQYETNYVEAKRIQSSSERGWIERYAGITSFKEDSPAGKIFNSNSSKKHIINLPQYVSPEWNDEKKSQNIEKYGGEDTLDYKIHIKAEVCKDSDSVYDMDRIYFNPRTPIKHFELDKKDFWRYETKLIIDKAKNSFRTWISSDFGERVAEIMVLFELMDNPLTRFNYEYNITLYNLVPKEQIQIFQYLIKKLNPNFVGIDFTDGGGRNVLRDLRDLYPRNKDCFVPVHFREKMPIGFKKITGDSGKEMIEKDSKGDPILEYEDTFHWSIVQNQKLLYGNRDSRITLPLDPKLDRQLRGVVSARMGNNIKYASHGENHLHQALQVFSIMLFRNENNFNEPIDSGMDKPIGISGSITL